MQRENKKRSILKAVSWRVLATMTTAVIVFMFTGAFTLAITVGFMEVFAKMGLYFFHERLWQKLSYGKEEIPSFVLWFTGLSASGKKELAQRVYEGLKLEKYKVDRIDGSDVRPLFPANGFSPEEVDVHVGRVGHLCSILEKNGVIVIATFVSPYRESREFARGVAKNFVEVYMKTTPEACELRDTKGRYERARSGEYRHFPGVDVDYEPSANPEIVIDVDNSSVDEAYKQVMAYLKKNVLKAKPLSR